MIERAGDLFEQQGVDAICITTNGAVRRDGACVMGRGVAFEAVRRWPGIDYRLGRLVQRNGNAVQVLTQQSLGPQPLIEVSAGIAGVPGHVFVPWDVVSFPVKHHWREQADLALIERSASELAALATNRSWKCVALVRPGCGNGGLRWDAVRPVIAGILDDRFVVVERQS